MPHKIKAKDAEKCVNKTYAWALDCGPLIYGESLVYDAFVSEIVYAGGYLDKSNREANFESIESALYRAESLVNDLNKIIGALEQLESGTWVDPFKKREKIKVNK